jgi:hypothetical protein
LKRVRDARSDSQDEGERRLAEQREKVGGWVKWLAEHVDFDRTQAHRFIQSFEQFANVATSRHFGFGKLQEIIRLPKHVDRQEFISTPHIIPSTGESKTVDEMTVRELREVKKALKEAQELR